MFQRLSSYTNSEPNILTLTRLQDPVQTTFISCWNRALTRSPEPSKYNNQGNQLIYSGRRKVTCPRSSTARRITLMMAPDLNSVPLSPRSLASSPLLAPALSATMSSQRASSTQTMPPPPVPATLPLLQNILPSNQSAVANNQSLPSPGAAPPTSAVSPTTVSSVDNAGVGAGPGPLRHPRPLTAADLHMQLEKEQEATVSTPIRS